MGWCVCVCVIRSENGGAKCTDEMDGWERRVRQRGGSGFKAEEEQVDGRRSFYFGFPDNLTAVITLLRKLLGICENFIYKKKWKSH